MAFIYRTWRFFYQAIEFLSSKGSNHYFHESWKFGTPGPLGFSGVSGWIFDMQGLYGLYGLFALFTLFGQGKTREEKKPKNEGNNG